MEVMEAIRTRRSIRKFTSEPIAREDLEEILDAACCAPSGQNLQPWYFVALTKKEDLAFLFSELGTNAFSHRKQLEARFKNNPEVVEETLEFEKAMGGAPCIVLAFHHKNYTEDLWDDVNESVAAACENLILAAHDKGIASCWVNAVNRSSDALQKKFAPEHGPLMSGIILGYANMTPRPIKKKADRSIIL